MEAHRFLFKTEHFLAGLNRAFPIFTRSREGQRAALSAPRSSGATRGVICAFVMVLTLDVTCSARSYAGGDAAARRPYLVQFPGESLLPQCLE
jgi:hypothetical protein